MSIRNKFLSEIKTGKINRFMIFGSVILFSSCGKQTKEATHIPSKASVTISDRLIKKESKKMILSVI